MTQPPPASIDRYEIIEELGSGAMGVVYKARDPYLKEFVAIKKLISTQFSPTHMVRFQVEAKAISQLKHHGFVEVLNFGIDNTSPYMVLKFIDGVSLEKELDQHGRLDAATALDFAEQIATAMAHAHKNKVVHRDLKPANMMIVGRPGEHRKIKIIDFGIAVLMNQELTGRFVTPGHALIGTPHYMSPEQIENRELDNRSDIYSLGCILFLMLTGSAVFTGDNVMEVLNKHSKQEPSTLAEASKNFENGENDPNFSEHLEATIRRALAKNPDDRFQSMEEFRDALNGELHSLREQERLAAHKPASIQEALGAISFKQRTTILMIIGAVCLLAAGIAGVSVFKKLAPDRGEKEVDEHVILTDDFSGAAKNVEIFFNDKNDAHNDEYIRRKVQNNPKIRVLRVNSGPVTDNGLELLKGSTTLKQIELENTSITDEGLKTLCGIKTIEHLDIKGNYFTADGLKHLAQLKNLKVLEVDKCKLSVEALDQIGKAKGLVSLSVSSNVNVGATRLRFLDRLPDLRALNILNCNLKDKDLPKLAKLKKLRHLDVSQNGLSEAPLIDLLHKLEYLNALNVSNDDVSDRFVTEAIKSKSLSVLSIDNCPKVRLDYAKAFKLSKPDRMLMELNDFITMGRKIGRPKQLKRYMEIQDRYDQPVDRSIIDI